MRKVRSVLRAGGQGRSVGKGVREVRVETETVKIVGAQTSWDGPFTPIPTPTLIPTLKGTLVGSALYLSQTSSGVGGGVHVHVEAGPSSRT